MRIRLVLALASLAVAVWPATPGASAQSPTGDSVTGTAKSCDDVDCLDYTFLEVDAQSGPSGENPSGAGRWEIFRYPIDLLSDQGPVTCLAVSGNTAIIGWTGGPGFVRTLIRVTDGGPSAGQDSFAGVTQHGDPAAPVPPPDCSSFPPGAAGVVSSSGSGVNDFGDIVVHDAPRLPASKDQCKNGGWQAFGVFKNQGDCVSFVATGGKNPPAGGS